MQVLELQDQLQRVGERLPPPSPDSFDRVVLRARKRLRRRRSLIVTGIAATCAAVAVPVGFATSTTAPEIVRVGPSSLPAKSHYGTSSAKPPVTPLIYNLLYQYSQDYEPFDKLAAISVKVLPWSKLAPFLRTTQRRLSADNWNAFPRGATVYVVLQTGEANPAKDGRLRYYWQLQVFSPTNGNTATFSQFYIEGPSYQYVWGAPARQPKYWSTLPGPEYVLNLKTGKVGSESNGR